jgi:hypothetical protein
VEAVINIEVVSSQIPFVIEQIPDIQALEDIEFSLDLKKYLIMIEGSFVDLKVSCTSKYSQVNNLSVTLLYTDTFFNSDSKTEEDVEITVKTNSGEYSHSTNFKVSVIPINDAPTLIDGKVSPNYGNISEKFTFEVNYYDPDGSGNFKVNIFIDENKYVMRKVSGKKSNFPGIKFNFTTKLGIGYHYYYFSCIDGSNAPNNKFSTETKKLFVTGNLDSCYSGLEPKPGATETQDLDKDGIPDCWEMENNLDPLNSSDALIDIDGDNFNNLVEYLGHDGLPTGGDFTDPRNAKDKPKIESISGDEEGTTFKFWQLLLAIIGLIISMIIIIYSVFSSRGVGISIRVPKIIMSPEVTSEHPYAEVTDTDKNGDDNGEITETDEEIEVIDTDLELEVDLTEEDKPFLESEELYEENLPDNDIAVDKEIANDNPDMDNDGEKVDDLESQNDIKEQDEKE